MNFNARVTLAIKNFFKKYGRIILIVFIIWLIVFLINQFLKNRPKVQSMINTYTPDEPIIDDGGGVPELYKPNINSTVENYFNFCNNKNYEEAYNMLTDECKKYLYGNDITIFKEYVDTIYNGKKIYNLQNYSNVGETYIYDMVVLDDIEATGTTGGYEPYKEKIALHKEDKGFKISNQGYIESVDYNIVTEDENIKVSVNSKDVSYKKEGYNVTLTNKTDKYIVIVDNSINNEITLNLGDQKRKVTNYSNATLVLNPGETREEVFIFDKFYDDQKTPREISLENVRVLENYIIDMENTSASADKMYSYNIELK